ARRADAAEDAGLLVERLEAVLGAGGGLAGPQEQRAALPQPEVQQREQPLLDRGLEVDQQVAAGGDVEAAERGVLQDVLGGEDDALAEVLADAVERVLLVEEA